MLEKDLEFLAEIKKFKCCFFEKSIYSIEFCEGTVKLLLFNFFLIFSLFSSAEEVVLSIEKEFILKAHHDLKKGDEETVKKLIVNGHIDVDNSRDPDNGQPLLHTVVEFGMYDFVMFLLNYGVDVNAEDSQSRTALHLAVSATNAYRDVDIVELLLEHGARTNERDNEGRTPLNRLASVTYNVIRDERIAQLLLEYGADVDATDNEGRTPLFRAASVKHRRGEGIAQLLLEHEADVDARVMDAQGKQLTALSMAVKFSNRPMVNVLLRHGANPNVPPFVGIGPLDSAFFLRDVTVSSWLVAHGTQKSNLYHFEGRSEFSNEFMEDYKKKAIQPLLKEAEGLHARLLAVLNQNQLAKVPSTDVADFLFAPNFLGVSMERFLHEAARRGDLEVAAALVREEGVDPSEFIDAEAAALIREEGVDVNETNLSGETPLFEALRVRNLSMAELLVRAGGDIHHWNYFGDTLLHQVLRRGLKEDLVIAEWLLEQGLDINAQNLFGDTALHEAAFDGRLQVLNFLLQNGASKRVQNHLGLTPAEIANFRALNEGGRVVSMLEEGDNIHCVY